MTKEVIQKVYKSVMNDCRLKVTDVAEIVGQRKGASYLEDEWMTRLQTPDQKLQGLIISFGSL